MERSAWSALLNGRRGPGCGRWAVRERRGLQVGFVAYLREDIHVVVAGLNPETFVVNPLGLGTAVELNKAVMEMMACHPGVAAVVLLGRSRQFEFESYLKVRCAQATPDPASAAIWFRAPGAGRCARLATVSAKGPPCVRNQGEPVSIYTGHIWPGSLL